MPRPAARAWQPRDSGILVLAASTFSLIVAGGITVSKQTQPRLSADHWILSAVTAVLSLVKPSTEMTMQAFDKPAEMSLTRQELPSDMEAYLEDVEAVLGGVA